MSEKLLATVVKAADSKHANEINILDMKGISLMADYFVVCHGNSDRQTQAIANEIKDVIEEAKGEVKRIEGFDSGEWILMDCGDVIVHIFHADMRDYYNLEKLWGDAPRLFADELSYE